ncbi:MAG: hypothetical protein R2811_09715 [Flavobacteriales bacterium]
MKGPDRTGTNCSHHLPKRWQHRTTLEGQDDLDLHKAQGHLLLARMGKRVLRPGGMELTRGISHRSPGNAA